MEAGEWCWVRVRVGVSGARVRVVVGVGVGVGVRGRGRVRARLWGSWWCAGAILPPHHTTPHQPTTSSPPQVDFDSATKIGKAVGGKLSTAFCPPEITYRCWRKTNTQGIRAERQLSQVRGAEGVCCHLYDFQVLPNTSLPSTS